MFWARAAGVDRPVLSGGGTVAVLHTISLVSMVAVTSNVLYMYRMCSKISGSKLARGAGVSASRRVDDGWPASCPYQVEQTVSEGSPG